MMYLLEIRFGLVDNHLTNRTVTVILKKLDDTTAAD